MMRSRILLTYAWCRTSYVALRSLSNMGLSVSVADENSVGMCQWSKYSKGNYRYRSFYSDAERFIEDVNRICSETECDMLIPSHDETEIIAKYRSQLPHSLQIPITSYEKLNWANDKLAVARTCEQLSLPCPETIEFRDNLNPADFPFPLVVKLRKGSGAKGVFYPQDRFDTIGLVQRLIDRFELPEERTPLIQKRVSGTGWGVSCLYWKGECLAHFTHKRIREKTLTGGTSTARISFQNSKLVTIAKALLDAVEWHGLAMVEFKYNEQTEEAYVLEINPRMWGSISLAVRAGVDFPAWLYLAATAGPEEVRKRYVGQKDGVVARWYLGELIHCIQQLKTGKMWNALSPLCPFPIRELDDFYMDDPFAFWGEVLYYLRGFIRTGSTNPIRDGMLG